MQVKGIKILCNQSKWVCMQSIEMKLHAVSADINADALMLISLCIIICQKVQAGCVSKLSLQ